MSEEARTEERSVSASARASVTSDIGKATRSRPHCRVLLLDGEYYIIPVHKKAKAQVVISELFRHLELRDLHEKEYFSVYYVDSTGSRIYLNPFKQIRKQLPNASNLTTWDLYFGVQFYATELSMLGEEITRYLYVLQMCRDIKEKRLNADRSTKLQLVSLLVQANCGDYDVEEHKPGYVDPYIDMIYNPAEIPIGLPNSVSEVHKEKTGFKPSEADNAFFMIAKSLYKFGQQIFPVCDSLGQSGLIGASILGVYFHKDGREYMNISWQDLITIGYRRRKLRIKYHPKGSDDEEMLYLLCSEPNSKLVWRGCVEQHTFFRLEKPTPLVSNTAKSYYSFNRNSELRFSQGRTLYQMMRGERKQQQTDFQRSLSLRLTERNRDRIEDDDVFLPARGSHRNTTIHDKEPEPIGLPARHSARNTTIHDKEPEPIGLPDRSSPRNETLYWKETHVKLESVEPSGSESDQIKSKDDTGSREQSLEPDSLQLTIEAAWKKKSEEHSQETEKTDDDQTDTAITATVEIDHADENKTADDDQQKSQNANIEFNVQQDLTTNSKLTVDFETTDPDGANVEFVTANKHNSSFMVTLEETSPSPPPDLSDSIMLEGKYRSDSIIPTQLDPAMQQFLSKQDGTVSATAVNVEVYTPTQNHNETKAGITDCKVNHFETITEDDTEVTINTHSHFVDM